jgi:predicted ATPase/DNA-binding SARP family transcriptional activator/Flp pilus assembly protein TadD
MPGLRLLLLGSPRLARPRSTGASTARTGEPKDSTPLRINRRKALALLAYLAVTGRPYQRETLATLFWPDNNQSRAYANLRRDLSVLNKLLGQGWLEIGRDAVSFVRRHDFWLDVADFRRHLATCDTHGHPAQAVCPACMPHLRQALSLYRGDFMAGFTLPDCPAFDEWQFFEAEELRCDLAGVLDRLVRGHTAEGKFELAIPYARRRLGLDPLYEPGQRQLMRLYAWSGNQAAALRQYQDFARLLEQELDQSPEAVTYDLYMAIRDRRVPPPHSWTDQGQNKENGGFSSTPKHDRAGMQIATPVGRAEPSGQAPDRLSHTVPPPQHNLPPQPTPFIGREGELSEIGRLLLDEPICRLLTLVGPGGIGKTRLALQAAEQALNAFPNGIYMVSLSPVSSPELLVPTIADTLSLGFEGRADLKAQLLNYLREKEMLLVLDNFEHLLAGAELVSDLLAGAPWLKLLVTSRERLNLHWEWVWDVRGLTFPPAEAAQPPADGVASVPAEAPGSDYSAVRLFVASARRVRPDFALTETDKSAVVPICQLVEGMPLGLELAAAWVRLMPCAEIAQEIRHNLDFLTTSLRDVPARHRSLRALFEHSWQLLSEDERGAVSKLSVFQGTFPRAAAQQVADASLPLLVALVDKSMLRGHPSGRYDMHELLRQYAADKLRESPQQAQNVRDRHCAYYAAFLQEREGRLRGGRQRDASAEIVADIDNVRAAWRWAVAHAKVAELGRSLESLHLFYYAQGWVQEGEEAFREAAAGLAHALDAGKQSDDGYLLALVHGQLLARQGRFAYRAGLYREATSLLQDSLEVFHRLEDQGYAQACSEKAFSLYNLGGILRRDGEYQRAQQLCQESLAIYLESGDRRGIARASRQLGIVAAQLGEYEEAQRRFQQALDPYRALDDQYGIANTLNDLGIVADALGQYAEAKRLYQECLAIRRQIGQLGGIGASLNNLGYFAFLHGEYVEAKELLLESLGIQRQIGDQHHLALCLSNLGAVAGALGEFQAGCAYFNEALRFALEIWALPLVLEALAGIATLLAASQPEERERAAELYTFVLNHPASDKPMQDRVERELADLASQLSPQALAAAQERAETRELEVIVAEILAEITPGQIS